jgi:hypothetical protein
MVTCQESKRLNNQVAMQRATLTRRFTRTALDQENEGAGLTAVFKHYWLKTPMDIAYTDLKAH